MERFERCLNNKPGEIEEPVKILATRNRTERPHGALLQLNMEFCYYMYRIGGRQGSSNASYYGADGGIPLL